MPALPDDLWRRTGTSHATARRVFLFGLFGSGNSGNDASLEAMLQFLSRRPGIDVTCICNAPEEVYARYGIRGVPFGARLSGNRLFDVVNRLMADLPRRAAGFGRAVLKASQADVLIFPGTGILDDFGTGPLGMPLAVFGWCLGARLGGARIAFVSIGAGPIHHPVSRWLMGAAAAMAHYRSYRDTVSHDFMTGIGVRGRAAVFPDLAFALPVPPASPFGPGPALRVGLGVMGYYGWSHDMAAGAEVHRAYLDKIRRFALWLLDRGCRIRLLTGDTGDRAAVETLAGLVSADRPDLSGDRLRCEPTADLHALMGQIADTDIVVATRFHNVVAALKLGRPVLSIGYASKNDALLEEMGLAAFCQHIDTLDVDRLIAQFALLQDERAGHAHRIQERVATCRRLLDEQDARLAARLRFTAARPAGFEIRDGKEQRR